MKRHFCSKKNKEIKQEGGGGKRVRANDVWGSMTHRSSRQTSVVPALRTSNSTGWTESHFQYTHTYFSMAHRRVKEIDYDEDEYDDYYSGEDEYGYEGADTGAAAPAASQEDELSPEDKEQMRIGTENVRAALGDASDFVTDDAIQEALWHYYYDVAKSVTYLKSKVEASKLHTRHSHLPDQNAPQQAQPKEKKQKQVSKFDQAATSAAQKPVQIKGTSIVFLSFPLPVLYQERHHTHVGVGLPCQR